MIQSRNYLKMIGEIQKKPAKIEEPWLLVYPTKNHAFKGHSEQKDFHHQKIHFELIFVMLNWQSLSIIWAPKMPPQQPFSSTHTHLAIKETFKVRTQTWYPCITWKFVPRRHRPIWHSPYCFHIPSISMKVRTI